VYALYGALCGADVARIKGYLINAVDSREASLEKPTTLALSLGTPADVAVLTGFTALDEAAVAAMHADMGMAMSVADLLHVQAYFRQEQRDPTITEIKVIDTYWSDHCRHTTFLTRLDGVDVGASGPLYEAWQEYLAARNEVYAGRAAKPVTLMDVATMGMRLLKKQGKLQNLDESDEINACSIEADIEVDGQTQRWLIQFKNETHNHPTEIEPFGGAATCLGGAIRDPLSGRAYVYQAMRVTGAGDPRVAVADTLSGKLPQRKITLEAAHGYSSYGNQIGLATGQVVEYYDPGFVAKRMEIGAVIGAVPADHVRREAPQAGDIVVLLGGRTGRDGCGGATGSSKAHTEQSIETCGAEVQKGNPPTERKLQRLFRDPHVTRLIKRCNDFGAGGVCVAVGELSDALEIDLDAVPRKYEGLDGTELAISESQERMAVVVAAADVEAFIALAAGENLEATAVARVTDTGRMRMSWRGRVIVDLRRDFLDTNGAPQHARAAAALGDVSAFFAAPAGEPGVAELRKRLGSLEECSQIGLGERFDGTIGAASVLMPFGGRRQLTPAQAMAAKVPLLQGQTDDCSVMTHGFFPALALVSPFHGAAYAVVESLCRVAAAGADVTKCYLTFQEYFERLGTDATRWGKPLQALLGAFLAQKRLGVAAIGGKDSMSGSFGALDVPPTLVSFAVGMHKASGTASAEFKRPGSPLVLLRLPRDASGMPDWAAVKANCAAVTAGIASGDVLSAHTVSRNGAACAVAKMAFGNWIGAQLDAPAALLFAAELGGFVLELRAGADAAALLAGLDWHTVGRTTDTALLTIRDEAAPLDDLLQAWRAPLEPVFPTTAPVEGRVKQRLFETCSAVCPKVAVAKPRVLIPVFPGTNCEVDSARAFEQAGAIARVLVLRNRSAEDIAQSVAALAAELSRSQILMLPGGFSAGDEPDGSGKFIAAVLRQAAVADAVTDLLEHRDGLALGICNGFQALIKVGLVPYGRICDMRDDSPTLTFNAVGRHVSRLVRTVVSSVHSPWLAGLQAGDVLDVAVSHGEGRFVCAEAEFDTLLSRGQIAMQYCDEAGVPTYESPANPNGSLHAVEALLSPDGRVLGKMGHSERRGSGVYRNVEGQYDSRIFRSGVEYFQ
jgi:phosphoribosylformylglycinamidine synthase